MNLLNQRRKEKSNVSNWRKDSVEDKGTALPTSLKVIFTKLIKCKSSYDLSKIYFSPQINSKIRKGIRQKEDLLKKAEHLPSHSFSQLYWTDEKWDWEKELHFGILWSNLLFLVAAELHLCKGGRKGHEENCMELNESCVPALFARLSVVLISIHSKDIVPQLGSLLVSFFLALICLWIVINKAKFSIFFTKSSSRFSYKTLFPLLLLPGVSSSLTIFVFEMFKTDGTNYLPKLVRGTLAFRWKFPNPLKIITSLTPEKISPK